MITSCWTISLVTSFSLITQQAVRLRVVNIEISTRIPEKISSSKVRGRIDFTMAKRKSSSSRAQTPKEPKAYDARDARLGPITTYQDVADSQDEFLDNREEFLEIDSERKSKRRRKSDEELELSDEEILAASDPSSSSDNDGSKSRSRQADRYGADEDDEEAAGDAEEDQGWWGSSRKEYYNNDQIETEADALEEEAEAKRMQKKKLSKMTEEDFAFDGDHWLAAEPTTEGDDETSTEVLRSLDIPDGASPEEMVKLLKARYPEFEHLAKEFENLQPLLSVYEAEARNKPSSSLEAVRFWILGCYLAALASYFAIMTSPAREATETHEALDPAALRDHEVMGALVECRNAWQRVQTLKTVRSVQNPTTKVQKRVRPVSTTPSEERQTLGTKKQAVEKPRKASRSDTRKVPQDVQDSLAELYDLPLQTTKSRKLITQTKTRDGDDSSDFGDEDVMDARAAASKAARKKTLKFYTSQVAQKANKRVGAGRDAGGDMDIPYRERFRDRQVRLVAEAEKRGKRGSKFGAELGDESDEGDAKAAQLLRNNEDDYYDMVAHSAKTKKDGKVALHATIAAAGKMDRVVENEEIGDDGKRKITYAIEKNKGLAPKRKKDVRNPRVKKRKQYESKQKKLRSMKPVWKGGEPKGGYHGETSGINTAVVKSIKL